MRTTRDLALLALVLTAALTAGAEPEESGGGLFGLGRTVGGRGPVTVTARTLEYDYKRNVVTYRGDVDASQGQVRVRSDVLTITLAGRPGAGDAAAGERVALEEVVASGRVRIDQGTRWATGGRAVFDQRQRTLLLTEAPVLHDGPNEIAGDRVVVYLDENRSVVEGGRGRVKAVLFPDADSDDGPAP